MARSKISGEKRIGPQRPQTDSVTTRFSSEREMFVQDWDKLPTHQQAMARSQERKRLGQQMIPVAPPS